MTESIAEHVSMSADDNIIMFQKKAEGPVLMEQTFPKKNILYLGAKRMFDVTASCIGLVVLSPLMLITAILVKAEDGGPVFFVQERVGKGGKVFKMYKLRSMRPDAEQMHQQLLSMNELDGPAFKMKYDPRITKTGRFLRKSSIDELPQLINVIRGDMSIVGPRPLPVYEQEQCNEYQNQRLLVQGGLTCYWQVCGRASVPFDEWVEMDLSYIREQSVWVDLKLIGKTMVSVVRLAGRYKKDENSLNK